MPKHYSDIQITAECIINLLNTVKAEVADFKAGEIPQNIMSMYIDNERNILYLRVLCDKENAPEGEVTPKRVPYIPPVIQNAFEEVVLEWKN